MLLTLVDSLRCPAHDQESSVVLSVEQWAGPRVAEGVLGCPVCHARYPIHHAAVDFATGHQNVRRGDAAVDPVRLAAQLSLTEPGGIVLLTGRYASAHEELEQFAESTYVLVDANPTSSATAVNFQVSDRLPFVDRALRAAAVDEPLTADVFMTEVVRSMRPGGRIVVPVSTPVPASVSVIAQDDRELVGEVLAMSKPVPLGRAEPRSNL